MFLLASTVLVADATVWHYSHQMLFLLTYGSVRRAIFIENDALSLGGGGWNCYAAFQQVRQYDLSAALFAPGWIVETMPDRNCISMSFR